MSAQTWKCRTRRRLSRTKSSGLSTTTARRGDHQTQGSLQPPLRRRSRRRSPAATTGIFRRTKTLNNSQRHLAESHRARLTRPIKERQTRSQFCRATVSMERLPRTSTHTGTQPCKRSPTTCSKQDCLRCRRVRSIYNLSSGLMSVSCLSTFRCSSIRSTSWPRRFLI